MTPILEVRNLKKHFTLSNHKTLHAVDGINLAIHQGEILGLVGESGCGKSTLGRTLAGLYEKTSGEVYFRGQPLPHKYGLGDFVALSREIQMIFQDPYSSLNPRMTVGEIIAEGPKLSGLWKKSEVTGKVQVWLERVGLTGEHASRYPHEFSGGQRQRIGIARALAMEPKFVICDEPISALDVSIQAQIINLLAELKNKFGLTLLFIAHDLSMVRYVSHRMAVMYLGSIVEIGPSDEIFFTPRHPYTNLLISSNPEPDPRKEKQRLHNELQGEIPTPINLGSGCRFAGRCPKVSDLCRQRAPELKIVAPAPSANQFADQFAGPSMGRSSDHWVACHEVESHGNN